MTAQPLVARYLVPPLASPSFLFPSYEVLSSPFLFVRTLSDHQASHLTLLLPSLRRCPPPPARCSPSFRPPTLWTSFKSVLSQACPPQLWLPVSSHLHPTLHWPTAPRCTDTHMWPPVPVAGWWSQVCWGKEKPDVQLPGLLSSTKLLHA